MFPVSSDIIESLFMNASLSPSEQENKIWYLYKFYSLGSSLQKTINGSNTALPDMIYKNSAKYIAFQ